MIAPSTVEILADVANSSGFKLIPRDGVAATVGVDAGIAAVQAQYSLLRGRTVVFDGPARECAAFLMGWRDHELRPPVVLRETCALEEDRALVAPCQARDAEGRQCLSRVGHPGAHATLVRWEQVA